MTTKIEFSTQDDLRALAACHKASFPNSLSSKMGNRFIMKMLSWYISDERGILFHLKQGDQYLGYCGGILIQKPGLPGAASSITQHSFKTFVLSFALRPWLLLHPENLKRLTFIKKNILARLFPKKRVNSLVSHQIDFKPAMGLVVIGVPEYLHSRGYGSSMLKEFERIAKDKGFKKITLSVNPVNLKAIRAYRKNDWLEGKRSPGSLEMYKLL